MLLLADLNDYWRILCSIRTLLTDYIRQ